MILAGGKNKQKMIRSSIGVLIAILLFFSSGLKLPVLDSVTDAYFSQAITKAGIAYAPCRVINASVSIVKDSSLQLEPAGVSISLAVGQALDPIDDMIERLSDVIVTAITSLGVQKLAYEISVSLAPSMISICLFALSILIWFKNALAYTVSDMGSIIKSLLNLTFLYVGIFLIQVIILPLLSFWFLVKTANTLFYTKIPVILHPSRPSKSEAAPQINPANKEF